MDTRYGTVAIVGVGLIGGSIGLALRQRGLADTVVGIGRQASRLDVARELGAITQSTTDLAKGVAQADVVVVCTPVGKVAEFVRAAAAASHPRTIITDAASTKSSIVAELEPQVADGVAFVGSHPLAGSHLTGVAAASHDLFVDRKVIVTPTESSDESVVESVLAFWTALGACTHTMSPQQHDQILAATSHVPHVVAAALAATTDEEKLTFAASGWQDTTRVAAGSVELWQDILQANRTEVLSVLAKFGAQIAAFRRALDANDMEMIAGLLEQGKQRRDAVGN